MWPVSLLGNSSVENKQRHEVAFLLLGKVIHMSYRHSHPPLPAEPRGKTTGPHLQTPEPLIQVYQGLPENQSYLFQKK